MPDSSNFWALIEAKRGTLSSVLLYHADTSGPTFTPSIINLSVDQWYSPYSIEGGFVSPQTTIFAGVASSFSPGRDPNSLYYSKYNMGFIYLHD